MSIFCRQPHYLHHFVDGSHWNLSKELHDDVWINQVHAGQLILPPANMASERKQYFRFTFHHYLRRPEQDPRRVHHILDSHKNLYPEGHSEALLRQGMSDCIYNANRKVPSTVLRSPAGSVELNPIPEPLNVSVDGELF